MVSKRLFSFLLIPLLLIAVLFPPAASAATFRSADTIVIDQTLRNLYASGGTITVEAPVSEDLTVAGGTININNRITGGLLAAGGTLNIDGQVDRSLRAAGGTIRVTKPVGHDVVLFGGTITLDETASISGDLIINGGTINIQSPVRGNVFVNGGQVTLNAPVGGNVQGEMGTLILGREAIIRGDLTYTSSNRATLREGAEVRGQERFTQSEKHEETPANKAAELFTGFALYKLIADILSCLILIYLFYSLITRVIVRQVAEPVKNGFMGFATLILGPVLGVLLLVLILPGILAFILYGLLVLLAIFVSKLLVGYFILRWWYSRDNKTYILDWKAAVIGPIVLFLILLIPLIGWLIGGIIYFIVLGSFVNELFASISSPGKTTPTATTRSSARRGR